MSSEDIFSNSEKDMKVGAVKQEVQEVDLKVRSKRASSLKKGKMTTKEMATKEMATKVKKENDRYIIQGFGLVQNIDEEFFEEVVLVNPEQSPTSGRRRIKYSVSQDVNRRFLITLEIL